MVIFGVATMKFRHWLQDKWYQHLEELESYGIESTTTPKIYFSQYKYWLKRQYRIEKNLGITK